MPNQSQFGNKPRYKQWFELKEQITGNAYEQLVEWRSLEILLHREAGKQPLLFPNEELSGENLDDKDGNDVKIAAKLFLNRQYKIPFYCGIEKRQSWHQATLSNFSL